jgi:hypothetical protein
VFIELFGILLQTNEAHRLSEHVDYILVDELAGRREEEICGGDVEYRDGSNERVRPDETHFGLTR